MPRYYFDIHNDDVTDDYEGVDLADDHAARAYAIAAARALAAETTRKGHLVASHRIDIKNERHEFVESVRFGDAVRIID